MEMESLANEILLDLFEYLHGAHLLRAFYRLNTRFDNLLIHHFQLNSLDFNGISNSDFDIVCQEQLPSFANYISSLYFPNQDKYAIQTKRFFFRNLTLSQFSHLRSLTLNQINYRTMENVFDDICQLIHLTYLYMIKCSFLIKHFDNILRLPKLTHCIFDGIEFSSGFIPTAISSTLQNLTVELSPNYNLNHLLEHMPNLQYLSLLKMSCHPVIIPPFTFTSLKTLKLKLSLKSTTFVLENLIQYLPNLYQLVADGQYNVYVDGYQWKNIITQYIPKLRIFHLRMGFTLFKRDSDVDQRLNLILNPFRDSFWTEEHQWFIRCHYHQRAPFHYLYTLPYTFNEDRSFSIYHKFKSTCPNDNNYYLYPHVRKIDCSLDIILSKDFFYDRFLNIRKLEIKLPIDDDLIQNFPTLNQLKSLYVGIKDDNNINIRYQLQLLLDKAPNLFSLSSRSRISTDVTSKSIRQLKYNIYSNITKQMCIEICNSSLGIQCEILEIKSNEGMTILYLIENMPNLRLLKFKYDDFAQNSTYDDLLEWLEKSLPSTWMTSRRFRHNDSDTICVR